MDAFHPSCSQDVKIPKVFVRGRHVGLQLYY